MTFDDDRPEIADGVMYIDDTGILQGVAARGGAGMGADSGLHALDSLHTYYGL